MGNFGAKNLSTSLFHCTLWKSDTSPACRAVMMGLDAMNVTLTEVDVNMDKAEHQAPDLIAMNPRQTLPILKDGEFILCDSHAINTYIASRYCDCEKLLPTNPAGRAIVDQLLHYDSGILYPHYRSCAYPILYENSRFVMHQQIKEVENAYRELETMLKGRSWFSGANMTLGDIAIMATVSTLHVLIPVDKNKFPVLLSWMFRMSKEPFYTTGNLKGLNEFTKRIDTGNVLDSKENKRPRSSLTRRSTGGKLAET
ncbi:glutathione S-transferase 1-like isoform X2 [Maniola jurtina]|uniref:glutathione S-transferase 1-like isoform X2 n=1 Tax=Maniola jurtina TaxID=191418 RepID=UPI001E68CE27|nr:glutathione S-transferase 1-like isoform X2 [Maniola jurtina]